MLPIHAILGCICNTCKYYPSATFAILTLYISNAKYMAVILTFSNICSKNSYPVSLEAATWKQTSTHYNPEWPPHGWCLLFAGQDDHDFGSLLLSGHVVRVRAANQTVIYRASAIPLLAMGAFSYLQFAITTATRVIHDHCLPAHN